MAEFYAQTGYINVNKFKCQVVYILSYNDQIIIFNGVYNKKKLIYMSTENPYPDIHEIFILHIHVSLLYGMVVPLSTQLKRE